MLKKYQRQAWGKLLAHYRRIFSLAWKERDNMRGHAYQIEEAQFLPAALALQEMPVSPAPRIAMWALIIFSLLVVLWATFGQIDIVASAQGKVVPSDRTKTIQSLETARVKAIYVKDNQTVREGDVLIDLDATSALADADRSRNELSAAQWQVTRAKKLLEAISTGTLPPPVSKNEDVLAQSSSVDKRSHHAQGQGESVNAVNPQESYAQIEGMFSEYRAKLLRLEAVIARNEAELQSTRQLVRKLEKTIPIAKKREQDYKILSKQGFVTKHSYLDKKQSHIEMAAELATQRSRTKAIAASLREALGEREMLVAETRRTALDSMVEGEQKVASLQQEFIKADTRGKLMQLTAPVDGTVQQLAVHTVGGVVTAAQPLMLVVPQDHEIEIEAFVENKDIGFIKPGQDVQVKVETFLYTQYGTLPAKVTHVAHDAIEDKERGLIYAIRVKLKKSAINVEGEMVRLSPGMSVTAEIKIGKRRVISYFLSPLLAYQKDSLRER